MSHSLEVAQIAKSIAIKINDEHGYFAINNIDTDLVEFAGLAHDTGHPPFGHNGEAELDHHMLEYGGFEGNAQTLRILSRLEKKQTQTYPHESPLPVQFSDGVDVRVGLNLTYRSLAAILKYDREIPRSMSARKKQNNDRHAVKGYCWQDRDIVTRVRSHVAGADFEGEMKTIECSIMDVADDIAYSTYDLEDAFKGGFLSPLSILAMPDQQKAAIAEKVQASINKNYGHLSASEREFTLVEYNATLRAIFSNLLNAEPGFGPEVEEVDIGEYNAALVSVMSGMSDDLCFNGYYRTEFTSDLVGRFIRAVNVSDFDEKRPALTKIRLNIGEFIAVEVLKTLAFNAVIMSPRLKSAENRGRQVIAEIFEELSKDEGYLLMPDDWRRLVEANPDDSEWKNRMICDYIAGMTDAYCVEFYERILGRAAPSIQKHY